MKHLIVVAILVIIVTALVLMGLSSIDLVPELASDEGVAVDQMFTVQIYIIAFIFSLIIVFMLYSVVVFRPKRGDMSDGPHVTGNTALEITWTLIPLALVLGIATWGAIQLQDITAAEPDEMVVEVTGFQFGWRFDYPEYGVSSGELYLPVGRQVLLRLTSTDVIHDFWVPEFRIKQDAVPGTWNELRVTPTEIADFTMRCAELCGYAHSAMVAPVRVVEPDEFEAWLEGQDLERPAGEELSPVELGAKLAEETGCLSCHSVDGSALVGPSWLGLFGTMRQLEDGSAAAADEAYLRTSILEPQSQVEAGYPNIMPAAYTYLSDEELEAMVEYIKSLGE